jgi:hypothetical protein
MICQSRPDTATTAPGQKPRPTIDASRSAAFSSGASASTRAAMIACTDSGTGN